MESAEVRVGAERASDDTPPRDRFVGDQVSRRRRAKFEGAERLAVMENEDHPCEGGKGVIDGRDHVSMFQS